jgi:hypoxanthine phosphoribosyltransferase
LNARKPASISLCVLLDKYERREVHDIVPDFTGFKIENEFVVGYGLDYGEKYRNLPFIGILKPSVYED